jgi:EAL domain-containing protein (putative c-di-GMP-specific phosphodiesterase class I)
VETEVQRDALQAMGCACAQGFLFGKPAPAEHWLPD